MRALARAARPRLFTALAMLPSGLSAEVVAVMAVASGLLVPSQRAGALRWASHHDPTRWGRWRLAVSLLANRGRCIAFTARLGMRDVAAYRRRVVLRGAEHLEAALRRGGTLLVGLHVGPGRTSAALHAHGYALTSSGTSGYVTWRRSAAEPARAHDIVRWSARGQDRALGLYRLGERLRAGEIVAITADARSGRPAMWAPVPGGRMPLRSGWFVLRRQTGAAALPVLSHLEASRQIVTIHPPLPPPVPDLAADREQCRAAMGAILSDYARRHPAQAFSLAFQSEPAPHGAP